jgi:hypothetical protein
MIFKKVRIIDVIPLSFCPLIINSNIASCATIGNTCDRDREDYILTFVRKVSECDFRYGVRKVESIYCFWRPIPKNIWKRGEGTVFGKSEKSKVAAIKKCKIATRPHPEENPGHREIKQKGKCIMSAEWGFGEWFFLIWAVCYLITFLIFIKADKNVEHWLGYSIVCVYFWPLMWIYWICSSLGDD